MKLCCTRPPMLYLCITLWLLTLVNCIYILVQVLIPQCLSGSPHPLSPRPTVTHVSLVETSEHTILSRIRFPNRDRALLYGQPLGPHNRTFILGIPSVDRQGQNYLNTTIQGILSSLSPRELSIIRIVIFLTDQDKSLRLKRGARLYKSLREHLDSGLIQIIQAPDNIYPFLNYSQLQRTFNDSPGQIEWRSKICLDFSFLMSYSSERSGAPYFIHLEDDILPLKGFINATLDFLSRVKDKEWASLQLSDYASIGRLYRSSELHKLVDFILIFYTRMPVDWLMAEYDRLQTPDNPISLKVNKSLFAHGGDISSKETYLKREQMAVNKKYDEDKRHNPSDVVLLTNMRQYSYFALNYSYFPSSLYFWCIPFPGGSIDLVFHSPKVIDSVTITSGLEKSDGRGQPKGSDGIKDATLQFSPKMRSLHPRSGYADCSPFEEVATIRESNFRISGLYEKKKDERTQCIRIQMGDTQTPYSSWLAIKLIKISTIPS